MPQPNSNQVHVNAPLTQLSVAWIQDQQNFVADKVFQILPVDFKSDIYYTYPRDDWFRDDAQERGPSAESAGSGYTLDNTQTYNCRVWALHKDVSDQITANADTVLNMDRDATLFVTQKLLLRRERQFVSNYCTTNLWTGATSGNDQTGVGATPGADQFLQWDLAGSTPIETIRAKALEVAAKTGFKPNVLLLGPYVANGLVNNPEIVDRVKYTQIGFLDYALLAQAFGVEEVVVPMAVYNQAAENLQLQAGFIHGNYALLAYRPPNPGILTPAAGYLFSWRGYLGGTEWIEIQRFRMQERRANRIEGEIAFDPHLVASDMAIFFTSCVSNMSL